MNPQYFVPVNGNPCLHCGNTVIDAYTEWQDFWLKDMIGVQCRACDIRTPAMHNLSEALELWNQNRHSRVLVEQGIRWLTIITILENPERMAVLNAISLFSGTIRIEQIFRDYEFADFLEEAKCEATAIHNGDYDYGIRSKP